MQNSEKEYSKNYFGSTKNSILEKVCHDYLDGLQFVILYYTNSVPSWNWNYPYYYAPSTYILHKYIDTYSFNKMDIGKPLLPFQQLMYILPPKSFNLLPDPLNNLYNEDILYEFYPDKVEIDLAGKKNDWQGIVLLPHIDIDLLKKTHNEHTHLVNEKEIKRNTLGKSFKYIYVNYYTDTLYKSYYGDIQNYKIKTSLIDIY